MKEYAKIVRFDGGYTDRAISNMHCRIDGIYEVKGLSKTTCKIIGEKGTTVSVNSTDVSFLSPDEIKEYEDSKINTMEELENSLSIEKDSYVIMTGKDTKCAVIDSDEKAEIKNGSVFYCHRIKTSCAYLTDAVLCDGRIAGYEYGPMYVVPGIYLEPYEEEAQPVFNNVPFLDESNSDQDDEPVMPDHETLERLSEAQERIESRRKSMRMHKAIDDLMDTCIVSDDLKDNCDLNQKELKRIFDLYSSENFLKRTESEICSNSTLDIVANALSMYLIHKLGDQDE